MRKHRHITPRRPSALALPFIALSAPLSLHGLRSAWLLGCLLLSVVGVAAAQAQQKPPAQAAPPPGDAPRGHADADGARRDATVLAELGLPGHLDSPSAVDRLCRHASPSPASAGEPEASPRPVSPRDYLKARSAQVMRLYSVDLPSASVELTEHDTRGAQVIFKGERVVSLFDGSYALALPEEPLLSFVLPAGEGSQLEVEVESGRVVLRLYFVLGAIEDDNLPYCHQSAAGVLQVQARLVGARLWRAQAAGAHEAEPRDIISTSIDPVGRDLVSLLGVPLQARPPAEPASSPASAPGRVPRVRVEFAESARKRLGEEALEEVRVDTALLTLPCFHSALAAGGPRTASISMELQWVDGEVGEVAVTTEMTGFPDLSQCVTRRLKARLKAPSNVEGAVRMVIYFELASPGATP